MAVGLEPRKKFQVLGLDPSERLSEITSGTAVVLTLLVGTSFYADDISNPRAVLIGVSVVAALAAGVSGGVMNVVEDLYEDAELRRDRLEITAADAEKRRGVVREQFEDELDIEVSDRVADELVAVFMERPPAPVRVERVNLRDLATSIVLNLVPLVPVLFALWLIGDWHTALLAAEIALVLGLFVTGYLYGRRLRFSPIVCGIGMMLVGVVLVAISSLSGSL